MVDELAIQPQEEIIEIGPGKGILTEIILQEKNINLTAIEIDERFYAFLKEKFTSFDNFYIKHADILKIDWKGLLSRKTSLSLPKLIGNLPFYIYAPIFLKLVEWNEHIHSCVITVQKEVGIQLLNKFQNKNKNCGVLSVIAEIFFDVSLVVLLPPAAFFPPPKVSSLVIKMLPKKATVTNKHAFFNFVRQLFQHRRKKILSQIKKEYPQLLPIIYNKYSHQWDNYRAEDISPADFLWLFQCTKNDQVK